MADLPQQCVRRIVALILLAFAAGCGVQGATEGPARFVSSWTYEPDKEWLGGFSGIDSPDGVRFAMVSDQGYFVRGRFRREGGRIVGFDRFRVTTQKRLPGARRSAARDAEGLVWDGGVLSVSLEGAHEVRRFATPGAQPEVLLRHPDFVTMARNRSLEALAMDSDGALLTLPEVPRGGAFALYRFEHGDWRRTARIPASDGYRAVGADVGPDGWFYLLERRMLVPFRFSSRVRRFLIEGDTIRREETLLETPSGLHDNLEGLTVWPAADGTLRLTMVSDDNFMSLQRTEFVEYAVPAAAEPQAMRR